MLELKEQFSAQRIKDFFAMLSIGAMNYAASFEGLLFGPGIRPYAQTITWFITWLIGAAYLYYRFLKERELFLEKREERREKKRRRERVKRNKLLRDEKKRDEHKGSE